MNGESRLLKRQLQLALLEPASRFWHWWSGELSQLVPERWRNGFEGRERVMRFIDGVLELKDGRQVQRIPLDQCATDPTLATWRTLRADSTRLLVLLPREELLCKVISLPAATEKRLDSVLGFELDRHTPFNAEQACFGYRIIRRDRSTQRIEVELHVWPHHKRQPLVDALAQAGLTPHWILPEGSERDTRSRTTLNLISELHRPQIRRTLRSRPVIVVLIFALSIGILFYKREQRLQELEAAVGPSEQAAEEARLLRTEIEALESGGRYILERRRASPPRLVLLDELTRLLPDDTWLSRFELEKDELRIQGESDSASGLIGLLENSEWLEQVGFTSPVTINPRSRKERFSLTARFHAPSGGLQP